MWLALIIVLYGTVSALVGFMLCASFTAGKISELEGQLYELQQNNGGDVNG
jgi:hypothetical protein